MCRQSRSALYYSFLLKTLSAAQLKRVTHITILLRLCVCKVVEWIFCPTSSTMAQFLASWHPPFLQLITSLALWHYYLGSSLIHWRFEEHKQGNHTGEVPDEFITLPQCTLCVELLIIDMGAHACAFDPRRVGPHVSTFNAVTFASTCSTTRSQFWSVIGRHLHADSSY